MPTKKHIIYSISLLVVYLLILYPAYAFAQSTWAHAYGGSNSDWAYSIDRTSDGGYIVAGYTNSFGAGNNDILILKLDSSGNVVWQKTYGGSNYDWAYSIEQTSDGGYIVAGITSSFGAGGDDIWILKLDLSGNVSWQKTYGGSNYDIAQSIQQTSDGGYIVAGYTESFGAWNKDIWVLKLDLSGNVTWQKIFRGSGYDWAYSIGQTSDGGYIIAGYTDSFGAGGDDIWVLKLDSSGNVSWQKAYGGSNYDWAQSIQQTSDGGYIVAGYTDSFGAGNDDFLILKLDSSGNVSWQKAYGGSNYDWAYSIEQTSDGGYIVAGYTYSFGAGNGDIWILKLDSSGNVSWQKTYGGSAYEGAYSIEQTSDGSYIIAAYTWSFGAGNNDYWILKLNPDGTMGSSCTFISDTSITPVNTTASSANTSAAVSTPALTITNTSVSGNSSGATDTPICFCTPPHGCMSITANDVDPLADTGVSVCWKQDPGDNPASWGDDSFGTRTYDVYRNGTILASSLTYGTTCFIDTSGTNSLTYTYAVRYNNGCGFNTTSPSAKEADYLAALISQKPAINDSGNGIIEPDESITLRGALHNATTSTATSVTGHLSSSSPVVIGNAHATYPDINPGNTENCLTCYTLTAPSANRPSTHWDFEVIETPDCAGCSLLKYNFIYHVGNSFSDVSTSQTFYPYIEKLLHSGVTSGCTSTAYCPSNTVRRDNITKFICLSMASVAPCSCVVSGCAGIFEDLSPGNIFCPYIEALYNAGIISGCSANPPRLCPDQPINRAQMAKFICNAMSAAIPNSCIMSSCTGIFQDVPASNVFCTYVEALYNANVVSGCSASPKLYCPNNNVQRDQMAKYLVNAFGFAL